MNSSAFSDYAAQFRAERETERRLRLTYVTHTEQAIFAEAIRDLEQWRIDHPDFAALLCEMNDGKDSELFASLVFAIDPEWLGRHRMWEAEKRQKAEALAAKEARKAAREAKKHGTAPSPVPGTPARKVTPAPLPFPGDAAWCEGVERGAVPDVPADAQPTRVPYLSVVRREE